MNLNKMDIQRQVDYTGYTLPLDTHCDSPRQSSFDNYELEGESFRIAERIYVSTKNSANSFI